MIVTVDRLGHLGDGIAGDLFVPGALPGEVVEGTVDGDRLAGLRILTPSPDRVKPPCPHARTCGGCVLQHASDALVARWKEGIVATALRHQGIAAEVLPVLASPPRSRRRAVFHARRTKGGALVGFHARGSAALVATPDCQLVSPGLRALLPALAALAEAGGSRGGELALTVTETATGADVAVTGGKALDAGLRQVLAGLAGARGLARLTWDGEPVALAAVPRLRVGAAAVELPPGAFLQATAHGQQVLADAVLAATEGAARVADLFAGCGTFALPLAARAEVRAVEADPAMVRALDRAARHTPGLKRLTAEARDLFRRPLEPDELSRFDAVVIDPPRAGAEAQVGRLAAARVPVVVMVSCNPATFARDARILTGAGFRMGPVQPVDQFRWSPHVELVATFRR
jgi:23S rRNA (uracil1939-C5)-methyltransferase